MPLSWNEIRTHAVAFSKEWVGESSEDAEAKSFWDGFFNVFGITRRRVASFETPVKKSDGHGGYIDLLWKGVLLVEHKSRGKDLTRAFLQALDYFPGLKERDLPRYVLVSDFARFRLYDLDTETQHEFPIVDLHKNVRQFGFIAGYQTRSFGQQDPVNVKAAEKLGRLHDLLKESGYCGHELEVFLVRLLFCLFAEDTSIFYPRQFGDYLTVRTVEDGSDLGMHLANLFEVLNTTEDRRQTALDEHLKDFPYVNGRLFKERLPMAAFNRLMRDTLLDCTTLDWSRISPAIFGSLFQSIMDVTARRNIGAHYTTETNILKALCPLLLDSLQSEFERIRRDRNQLQEFHRKLTSLRILDPACGCGNFLVIAYRELRLLEMEVLREYYKHQQTGFLDVSSIIRVDVDQFYGIEIEEFPAQIAQVALWLMDHQINMRVSEEFGQYYVRLPLRKTPHIIHGNALSLDWKLVVPPMELTHIVGNPPFVGAKFMSASQRSEVETVFGGTKNSGLLDYVTCWYRKAAEYMAENPAIRAAFVSTNSITQGEQVGALWPNLFALGVRVNFGHRTFQWTSEARGKAAVHCVIIGFALQDEPEKRIFDYETVTGEPHEIRVENVNPYLVDAPNLVLLNRQTPICAVPEIGIGNKPIDGGNYLFTTEQKTEFIAKEPAAAPFFKRWLGADEFINGWERWCLWLGDCPPGQLRRMPEAMKRVEAVRTYRLASKSAPTRKLAETPTRFHVENMPADRFLLIPSVSSERRLFIPIGFIGPETIASNLVLIIPHATPYHLGVLSSTMHMSWVRSVCGRLKSDYRYSAGIVYNNFPWPQSTDAQCRRIEEKAQGVLEARAAHSDDTLADLYDPTATPPDLVQAHRALDAAVDTAYGRRTFAAEAERVAFLFDLYRKITEPLVPAVRPARARRTPQVRGTRKW
ncbi:MAG: methylase [Deltaproteobacteria bacterium RBG_16_66_15]|nr:MAG: methylase [Deltaproteobacteria bacterium RBG_16_66_15]